MKGMKWLVLLVTAMITGCAQSPPEQQTINDAASALGGRDKILAVKTLILEGGGTNGNLGQDVTPEATSQTFTLTDYKRVVDVAAVRVRVEQTRTPNFTFFQGQQAQKQVFGIDGDVAVETTFADYQDVAGLRLPTGLTTKTDKYPTAEIRVAKQSVDGDAGDLAAPAAAASAAPIPGPPPPNVTVQEVAKGIWHLAGQSHHSVVVEFSDHLTLIETPQNEVRALAVIAKARELRPNKPLTHVINSHHHFDHSGGLRAAVSEGLTIITQSAAAPYYKEAMSRPHTIVPDALAKDPKPLKIETVDDEMVLKDDTMTVNLYHISGNPHADTLLMAYFPKERILVEADVFNPGEHVSP